MVCRSSGQLTRASGGHKKVQDSYEYLHHFVFSRNFYCNCLQYVACQILAAGGFFQLAVDIVGVDFDDFAAAGGRIE